MTPELDEFGLPVHVDPDRIVPASSWHERPRGRTFDPAEFRETATATPLTELDVTQLDPVKDAETLAAFRARRRPDPRRRAEDAEEFDHKVVDLLLDETSSDSLILALMTPDDREVPTLGMTLLEKHDVGHEQLEGFNDRLNRLHREKVAAFEAGMRERGLDASVPEEKGILDLIREAAADPESALAVPSEFWASYPSMSLELQGMFLVSKVPLPQAARVAMTIARHGLDEHAFDIQDVFFQMDEAAGERYASSLAKALASVEDVDSFGLVEALSCFKDPVQATRLAQAMGTDDYESVKRIFTKSSHDDSELIPISAETVDTLIGAFPYLSKDALPVHELSSIREVLSQSRDPARASAVLAGLAEFPEGVPSGMVEVIARHAQPVEMARDIKAHWQEWEALPKEMRQALHYRLFLNGDFGEITRVASESVQLCDKYGLPISEAAQDITFTLSTETADEQKIRDMAGYYHMKNLVTARMHEVFNRHHANLPHKPFDIKKFPKSLEFLTQLGIPTDMAEHVTSSWNDYSIYDFVIQEAKKRRGLKEDDKLTSSDLTWSEIEVGIPNKVSRFSSQLRSLTRYMDEYGVDEAVELYQTFGTVNFGRLQPKQFHDQLERWNGSDVPKNIAFVTDREYSTAFDGGAREVYDNLGAEGTFVFDAASKRDIARRIRQIGDRARALGADPEVFPTVEKVFLGGHGNVHIMDVGEDSIQSEDYAKIRWAEKHLYRDPGHVSPNLFRRDLGDKYELILKACLVAGKAEEGEKNLAESMAEGHQVRTQGAELPTYGISRIDAQGNVTYRVESGLLTATVYEGRA